MVTEEAAAFVPRGMYSLGKAAAFTLVLALPGLCGPGTFRPRLSVEHLWNYPLLPRFYETVNERFNGIAVSFPVHRRVELGLGMAWSMPYFDGPYNDVSNFPGSTRIFKLEAEAELHRIGIARFFAATGLAYARSEWDADDHAYEDPDEPMDFWSGSLSLSDIRLAPGVELFREDQRFDWSFAVSLPFFIALDRNLESSGDERFFIDSYMRTAGIGMEFAITLGL